MNNDNRNMNVFALSLWENFSQGLTYFDKFNILSGGATYFVVKPFCVVFVICLQLFCFL